MRVCLQSVVSAALLLLMTGCADQQEVQHPIDAAEQFMSAMAEGDTERMCELLGDPQRGPLPEVSRQECEGWARFVLSELSDQERQSLGETEVDSVSLTDSHAAEVLAENFAEAPPRLSRLELIEWDGQWYVEDVHFDN